MKKIVGFIFLFFGISNCLAQEENSQLKKDPSLPFGNIVSTLLTQSNDTFTLHSYDPNYLLYTYSNQINRKPINTDTWTKHLIHDEVKFQISLAFPLVKNIFGQDSLLAAAYTQQSWWQARNSEESAPFRETNYQPRIFLGWKKDYQFYDWSLEEIELGLLHHSNGRSGLTSRSWNRVYANFFMTKNNFLVKFTPWIRLSESKRKDDNPKITEYLGHYQLKVGYKWRNNTFSISGRYNWDTGYGNVELGWTAPLIDNLFFYTQLYSGYGESLIDYNFRQTRVGVGFLLNDLF